MLSLTAHDRDSSDRCAADRLFAAGDPLRHPRRDSLRGHADRKALRRPDRRGLLHGLLAIASLALCGRGVVAGSTNGAATPGSPYMVKDINTSSSSRESSSPSVITAVGSQVYFSAFDPRIGTELWKSNGTANGTLLVKDINAAGSSLPVSMLALDGALYFSADDGIHGRELWKSDGTSAGTVLIKDVNPSGSSSPSGLIAVNGVVYFMADDGVHGNELWRSDGTEGGTALVKDINPNAGALLSPWYSPPLVPAGGSIYFVADDGLDGTTRRSGRATALRPERQLCRTSLLPITTRSG